LNAVFPPASEIGDGWSVEQAQCEDVCEGGSLGGCASRAVDVRLYAGPPEDAHRSIIGFQLGVIVLKDNPEECVDQAARDTVVVSDAQVAAVELGGCGGRVVRYGVSETGEQDLESASVFVAGAFAAAYLSVTVPVSPGTSDALVDLGTTICERLRSAEKQHFS
jgi:hypothetical protein